MLKDPLDGPDDDGDREIRKIRIGDIIAPPEEMYGFCECVVLILTCSFHWPLPSRINAQGRHRLLIVDEKSPFFGMRLEKIEEPKEMRAQVSDSDREDELMQKRMIKAAKKYNAELLDKKAQKLYLKSQLRALMSSSSSDEDEWKEPEPLESPEKNRKRARDADDDDFVADGKYGGSSESPESDEYDDDDEDAM